jgi:hypothetical protein
MIWLYERGTEKISLATRFDKDASEYVLEITWPDGRTETERYEGRAFQIRLLELEQQFEIDRWRQVGPPKLIKDDWQGV